MNVEQMTAEFPFAAEMPKREKTKLETLWEGFENIKAITERHGILVPVGLAADLLGISRQRVNQLMEAGIMKRVEVRGHVFVTEDDLHTHARAERKAGRPPKVQTLGQVLGLAAKAFRK